MSRFLLIFIILSTVVPVFDPHRAGLLFLTAFGGGLIMDQTPGSPRPRKA